MATVLVTRDTPLSDAIRDAGWRRDSTTGHMFDAEGHDIGVRGYEGAWVALWQAGAVEPDQEMRASLERYVEWLAGDDGDA